MDTVERQDVATLRPTKWLNDSIINFVGKVMIQPRQGRDATKVHVFSSHLMNKQNSSGDGPPDNPVRVFGCRRVV